MYLQRLAHFALRELRYSGRKLLTVLYILSIGLIGPLFAGSLRTSVDQYLETRSRQMLSADLAISSMRPLEADEVKAIHDALKPVKSTREIEFVTMARGDENSALVEVKAEDPEFPIFGTFEITDKARTPTQLNTDHVAWVFPEVLEQLGLKVGDPLTIGKTKFRIDAVLEQAPGQGRTVGLAPRVYIGRSYVEETGLTQFGSQVFHRIYVQLPQGLLVEAASKRVKDVAPSPDIFLRTPADAIQGFDRFFSFFGLYLGAVIMIVFALSWAGAFYILQIFLQDRLRNAAIYLVNGASRTRTGLLYFAQVLILMTGAFAIATLIVQCSVLSAPRAFSSAWPDGFVFAVAGRDLLSLAGVAVGSAIAFTAPFFVKLYRGRLQTLLGENSLGIERMPTSAVSLGYVPTVLVFLGLSIWLMNSVRNGLYLASGMALTGLIGVVIGRLLFRSFFRGVRYRAGLIRLIATTLSRSRFGVNLCFLALVLVGLSMNLVPHMLESVVHEVLPIQGKEVPAFFLFNIPESQLEKLQGFATEKKVELRYLSPLVQARLLSVNDRPPESDQLQRFPVRISYREKRIPSETLLSGRDFEKPFDPSSGMPAEISVEYRFAERNGMKMGDVLKFDIQGIEVEAKIISLRQVKWTGFNPNFFIMFQPGVLEDAPKTWLANVNVESDEAARTKLQFELVREFPDLSVIDIGRTITRVLEIARSVIGPVTVAAWVAVAMSFLILIGIIGHNLRLRYPEVDIQKLLGADEGLIRRLIAGEYLMTAFFAWVVGSFAALGLAWFVVVRVLEIALVISYPALLISFLCSVLVTTAIAWISAGYVLGLRGASRKL